MKKWFMCKSTNVGFPSQMKKGVDKHHLFLDLRRHLSRDSRGLILEAKSFRTAYIYTHEESWSDSKLR